jgi:hypothetical protein
MRPACDIIGCEKEGRSEAVGTLCGKHSQQRYNDVSKGLGWPRDGEELATGKAKVEAGGEEIKQGEHSQGEGQGEGQGEEQSQEQSKGEGQGQEQKDAYEEQGQEEQEIAKEIAEILNKRSNRKELDELRREVEDLKAKAQRPEKIKIYDERGGTREIEGHTHYCFAAILELCKAGKLPYLCGPAGSGKTTIAGQIAEALGIDCYITGALQTKFELIGFKSATGEYQETSLYKAFKFGGVFLFDEMDASLAPALVAFNALLENGYYDFCGETVERHKDFVAIAGANTIGHGGTIQYSGRTPLDRATLDRFAFVNFQYDNMLEALISGTECIGKPIKLTYRYKWTGKESDKVEDCQAYCDKVTAYRDAANALSIQHIISPRASKNGVDMLRRGWRMAYTEEVFVWRGLEQIQVDRIKAEGQLILDKRHQQEGA